jgi:hypothetical protein
LSQDPRETSAAASNVCPWPRRRPHCLEHASRDMSC